MKLHDFRVLTFDCYGTLIDWESGIITALQPLLQRASPIPSREAALEAFARHELALEEAAPRTLYSDLLAEVHRRLAREWKVAMREADHAGFGASVPDWPAFPDSPDALGYLKQYYKLVILSNVHRAGFEASNRRLGVAFDAIYTAQDIGSYKPNPANFQYMLDRLAETGVRKTDILHTAQSLFHDHAPAKKFGLATAWIDRRHGQAGWGATVPAPVGTAYDFRFPSLQAMADAHCRSAAPTGS
jgi:2-haloalkanoic acid dehalogenase type II